jgi:hypothetical protein
MSVHGWLEMDPIVLNTRRGRVQLAPSKVAEIRFGRRDPRPRPLIRLFSGEVLEFEPAESSKLQVDTGFGDMSIPAEELKELSFDAARKQWTMITERLTAAGKISGTLGIDTPLGPLAVPVSELKEMKPPAGTPAPQIAVEDR